MSESSENSYIENFEVGDIVCWNSTINLENEKQNVGIILRIDKDSYLIVKELGNIHGVGEGKAKKYGKEFVDFIARYVEDNDIIRPDDLVVKSTGANSALKLFIIQSIDRKLPLDDISSAKGMEMPEFIKEMEAIVYSGTKLNIDYYLEDILDEDQQEELHEYFLEAETDKIEAALEEFDGDYDDEELRLYRIKFISEVAN